VFSILIVDDEPIIADMIMECFRDRADLSLDIHTAYSVSEALGIMSKIKMDIVITDINMPETDGLQFQEKIILQWPFCKVIFFTGLTQFDHIQKVMRKDGFDFVRKHEGEAVLIQAVERAIALINKEIQNREFIEKATEQLDQSLPLLRELFLMQIVSGVDNTYENWKEQFKDLGIPLNPNEPVILLLARQDGWADRVSYAQQVKKMYGIKSIAERFLRDKLCLQCINIKDSKLLWIIQPLQNTKEAAHSENPSLWESSIAYMQASMDSIQQAVKKVFDVSISMIAGRKPVPWNQLNDVYERFDAVLNESAGMESEVLLIEEVEMDMKSRYDLVYAELNEGKILACLKKINLLEIYLYSGQKNEYFKAYQDIIEGLNAENPMSHFIAKEAFYSLALIFLRYMNRTGITPLLEQSKELDLSKLVSMEKHISWDDITEYFHNLAKMVFKQKENDHKISTIDIIHKINQYIEENISEGFSLGKLAEAFHFNPSYLSRFYKNNTGIGLFEHISQIKLEKAKKLLESSNIKIFDITRMLGFGSPSYFTYSFKKATNLSPQEYRELHTKRKSG